MISNTTYFTKLAVAAGMLLALSADLAAAGPARVRTNTNLRQGPGTTYGVTATIPAGRHRRGQQLRGRVVHRPLAQPRRLHDRKQSRSRRAWPACGRSAGGGLPRAADRVRAGLLRAALLLGPALPL